MKKIVRSFLITLLVVMTTASQAETQYVTDRIELNVHQSADADSPVIATLLSGTTVEVMQEENGFKRVQMENGNEGWMQASYLVSRQPAAVAYGDLTEKHAQVEQALQEKTEQLDKVERELQVRRDELSNAKTTIQELKKQLAAGDDGSKADETSLQRLSEKEQQIKELQVRIETLKQKTEATVPPDLKQFKEQLAKQDKLNKELQTRIELAQEFLSSEQLPRAGELENWRPGVPSWYWGTLFTMLIIGIVAGIGWMDYRLRRRHGGFRV